MLTKKIFVSCPRSKLQVYLALHTKQRLCKHGERFDCKRDVGRKSHKEFDKASGKSQPVGGSFLKKDPVIENTGKGHD